VPARFFVGLLWGGLLSAILWAGIVALILL